MNLTECMSACEWNKQNLIPKFLREVSRGEIQSKFKIIAEALKDVLKIGTKPKFDKIDRGNVSDIFIKNLLRRKGQDLSECFCNQNLELITNFE